MKIYNGKHAVYNVTKIDHNRDIPLGYLDSEFMEESVNVIINDELSTTSKTELLPYSILDSAEITLYDKNGEPLNKEEQEKLLVKQTAGKYIYVPRSSVTFEPTTFNYKVLAKKNMKYLTSRKYNIKAACSSESLAKTMIQFFSDSYERNLCPTNVRFNNGDKKLESLFNSSITDIDFMFIYSSDGKTIDGTTEIAIDDYINKNTIPWIICDQLPDTSKSDYKNNETLSFELANQSVVNTEPFSTQYYFSMPSDTEYKSPNSGEVFQISYHPIFKYHKEKTPIIIKEVVDKGFVVYCNSDFITRLSETSSMLYETIMYVYLRAYISTQTINEWITDEMPNYIVQNGRLTQKEKFTSDMELHKLLSLREGDISPIKVEIENKIAYYTGMSSNYLVFKKTPNPENADPIKNDDQISIFTERKNVMFYDDFVYTAKEDITDKISCVLNDSKLKVIVKKFKNTQLDTGEFLTESVEMELTESIIAQDILLVWNMNRKAVELTTELHDNLVLMATIQVIREKKDSKLYDMRQRGGGLPEDKEDNYDCLDIGNILGRPYRKGGALITTVTVPKKYEHQRDTIHDTIYDAIKQHMVAEDYIILNLDFK